MFAPKLDAAAVLHRLVAADTRCASSCCSRRSPGCSARAGWPTTPRPPPSWTPSPTRAASSGCRPPRSTGDCGSRWPTPDEQERQVSVGSGLLPMADEVAIRALPSVHRPRRAGALRRWSPPIGRCWPTAYRTRGSLRIVDDLLPDARRDDDGGTAGTTRVPRRRCATASRSAGTTCWSTRSPRWLAEVMGLASAAVARSVAGFFQLGMDSLMSVTLQRALSDEPRRSAAGVGGLRLPDRRQRSPTIWPPSCPSWSRRTTNADADAYDDLTEDELLQQLSERLS